MNEPNGSPPGDTSKLGDWAYWQAEQNECLAAIRKSGNSAPIMVNMPLWSWGLAKIAQYPLHDPVGKIIFGIHRYADDNQSFNEAERTACDQAWASLADTYPIVVEEVGGQNPPHESHLKWNQGFLDYCADWVNHRHGSGVVAFNLYWCDDNSMTGDWRKSKNDGELTEWGRIFRDHYLKPVASAAQR